MENAELKERILERIKQRREDSGKAERYYHETLRNVESVLSNEAEGEAPLLKNRDVDNITYTLESGDMQITVIIDKHLKSLLIEVDPLIPCPDDEANYYMAYSVLNSPHFGSIDFNTRSRKLSLRAETSFNDGTISEAFFYQILDSLRSEVSQVREHIADIHKKADACLLDEYEELIYAFDLSRELSEMCSCSSSSADTIDRFFSDHKREYYSTDCPVDGSSPLMWLSYLRFPDSQYRETISLQPDGAMRFSVYFKNPIKGPFFKQAVRRFCNHASSLKTGHISYDLNYGFGVYIDHYIQNVLSEDTIRNMEIRCIRILEDIGDPLRNSANGVLSFSSTEDEKTIIDFIASVRQSLMNLAEEDTDEPDISGDSDSGSSDGNPSSEPDSKDLWGCDQLISMDDFESAPDPAPVDSGSERDPFTPDWLIQEEEDMA